METMRGIDKGSREQRGSDWLAAPELVSRPRIRVCWQVDPAGLRCIDPGGPMSERPCPRLCRKHTCTSASNGPVFAR